MAHWDIEEVQEEPGFYKCALFPEIIASREGLVKMYVGKKVGELLHVVHTKVFDKITYPVINLVGNVKKKQYKVHRILAFMFVAKPDDFNPFDVHVVNHIDGDKENYELKNLEWVTQGQNNEHAIVNGLTKRPGIYLVKDLRTNEVLRFMSMARCANHFGTSCFKIRWHFEPENRAKLFFNYFSITKEGEPWPNVDMELVGKTLSGAPRAVVVINIETNHAIIYASAGLAASALNMKPNTLRMRLWKNGDTVINGSLVKYTSDVDLKEKLEMVKQHRNSFPVKKATPIQVTNTVTREVSNYDSVSKFAEAQKVTPGAIWKMMTLCNGRWKNFEIKYLK